MLYLMKSGVPYDVLTTWSTARRIAAVVALHEMDGLTYDWDARVFLRPEPT